MIRRPPKSTPFPYTTLSRSRRAFDASILLGGGVTLLAAGTLVGGLGVLAGEFRSLARLRHIEALRAEAEHLQANGGQDRKSTRLNSSHANISYAVFCLTKKK